MVEESGSARYTDGTDISTYKSKIGVFHAFFQISTESVTILTYHYGIVISFF